MMYIIVGYSVARYIGTWYVFHSNAVGYAVETEHIVMFKGDLVRGVVPFFNHREPG